MPTVLRLGSYRFFFYSNEKEEPPVALAGSKRFASHELRTIQKHVEENRKKTPGGLLSALSLPTMSWWCR